ncbi:PhzF family phenazine biosynthesis protein [Lutispora saccharofermentans]|uniref:PhzF family phenazine biosynthesis protein n=1 Tax=Lutispora saccharofermentans TaxID=3024236 RepID=A0ABT1NKP8_9FIRM|nr:PhzF family phenazine biosynthesis protein [Lutispora saccharofermentans]MCQ1531669.1 PhzF family phenazine biosynthesis protein [Lutispora saccharofermentans]
MKQYILSSFISKFGGGNKAAVVFDDEGLNEKDMKAIAKYNNFSETAFISIKESCYPDFNIRYFTPEEEVDICGHAALASFFILDKLGYLEKEEAYHLTRAGKLKTIKREDIFYIQMKEPEIVGSIDAEDIEKITTLKEQDIITDINGKISIVSTGLKDAIIEVDSMQALKNMSIKKEEMIAFCKSKDIVGAHVVSRETIEEDSDFSCRNFAPAVGIDEESATGTSNASLIYYIKTMAKEKIEKTSFKIEQGYFMNSPSNIFVYADEKEKIEIYVGGRAQILEFQELSC